jgi:L-asparaginase II
MILVSKFVTDRIAVRYVGMTNVDPILLTVTRGGEIESMHRGSFVMLAPSGEVLMSGGEQSALVFPRSALKPIQSVALLRLGLQVPPEWLALASASHSGEQFHMDAVRAILVSADLDEDALENPAALPYEERVCHEWIRSGGTATRVAHNCSGKHAAMLKTCVTNGWSTSGYAGPRSKISEAVINTCTDLSGSDLGVISIDGCGAVAPQMPLIGLARAYQRIGLAPVGSHEHSVAEAIRQHPDMVGGTTRDVSRLMRACPGLVAKDGAEGVIAAVTKDGISVACKIADGASRGRVAIVVNLLRSVGVLFDDTQLDHEEIFGGSEVVGSIVAHLSL